MNKRIILDIGNANSHKNDISLIGDTINSIKQLQDKTDKIQFIVKFQMWSTGNKLINSALKPTSLYTFVWSNIFCQKRKIIICGGGLNIFFISLINFFYHCRSNSINI